MKQGTRAAVISASFPLAFIFVCLVLVISLLANHTSEKCDVNIFNHHIHNTVVLLKIDKNSLFPFIIFTDRGFNALSSPE